MSLYTDVKCSVVYTFFVVSVSSLEHRLTDFDARWLVTLLRVRGCLFGAKIIPLICVGSVSHLFPKIDFLRTLPAKTSNHLWVYVKITVDLQIRKLGSGIANTTSGLERP